ncbi:MAG: putative sulfate exporter family transporter [Acidobacteria bacterium]|nr:putative sulfate exporter family transporter [Acidobacteriota bacterium]
MLARTLFLLLAVFLVLPTGLSSPPLALALGVLFGLAFQHPYAAQSRSVSKTLLQVSVVALGFAMDLAQVLRAGASGFVYTLLGIVFALAIGSLLGRMLQVPGKSSYLISAGTAICGGSAIAAVGPVIDASDEEMSVSIGTVFILNAVGLFVFPIIGSALSLTQPQFGLWAALAIHDTSSVVGAGAKYGALALAIATTVKLARALWIVPLTLASAAWQRHQDHRPHKTKIQWPWFILFFLLAAVCNSYLAAGASVYPWMAKAGRLGLTLTLFLIGTSLTRESLKRVGIRPLVQGIVLWIIVAAASLLLIRAGWISI